MKPIDFFVLCENLKPHQL